MERKRKRFDEERLSWRAWSADADALPSEWQVSPFLRETVLGMREGIQQAIADAERADAPSYEIVRGQLLAIIGGRSTYQFYLKKDADLEDQTTVFAMIPQQAFAETPDIQASGFKCGTQFPQSHLRMCAAIRRKKRIEPMAVSDDVH